MNLITFPTDFGKRRIVCYNVNQLNKYINEYNGKTACFASVYPSMKVYRNPPIDKAFFDFDQDDSLECLKTLHHRLMEDNIKHYMQMSGKGFHCFLFTKFYDEGDISHKKAKVKSLQLKYCHDLTYDRKIVGDIARLFRIPNTWNVKAKRFCIPITTEMLEWTREDIYGIAKEPRNKFCTYGGNLVDLNDIEIIEEEDAPLVNIELPEGDDFVESLLPCTRYALNRIHPSHDQKVAAVADIKFRLSLGQQTDTDNLVNAINDILWKYCKWTDLNSIMETRRQIQCVVNGITFGYSCETKRNEFNMCVEGCSLSK